MEEAKGPAVVRRGDVWLVTFAGSGSEVRGRRPALVIQNDIGNRFARTTIVAAISRRAKPIPVHVPVPAGMGGLDDESVVNLAQVYTIAKERLERRLGQLDRETTQAVDRAIAISLALHS